MNAFLWYLAGFATATALAIFWFRGQGKDWLDKQKRQVAEKVKGSKGKT